MKKALQIIFIYGVVASLVPMSILAGGRPEKPITLSLGPQQRTYISPGVKDGVTDFLEVQLASVIDIPPKSSVTRYEFNIFNSDGFLVYIFSEGKKKRINAFGAIKWSGKKVPIPESLQWDGHYSEGDKAGQMVEDGDYSYQIVVTDVLGNEVESPPFGVTVDNTPPIIDDFRRPSNAIFSPNGDGIRDEAAVYQSGSREVRWEVQIWNKEGKEVRTQVYENAQADKRISDIPPPKQFTWDGTDNNGEELPEGVYVYVLRGIDRAGNVAERKLPHSLVINRGSDPLVLLPKDGGAAAFSPNGDGSRDILELIVKVYDEADFDSWRLSFTHENKPEETIYYRDDTGPIPDDLALDGKDAQGNTLEDGAYIAEFTLYAAGAIYASNVLPVTIDTVSPRVVMSVQTTPKETRRGAPLVFGGEERSAIHVMVQGDPDIDWHGVAVLKKEGAEERLIDASLSAVGMKEGKVDFNWKGQSADQEDVSDGLYEVRVEGYDGAGNYASSLPLRIRKDTSDAQVAVEIDGQYVSPAIKADDKGYVTIRPQFSSPESIDEFHLEISNKEGRIVRSLYKRKSFNEFRWRGFTNANLIVEDGEYFVTFRVKYFNGNTPEAKDVGPIVVDSTPPKVEKLSSEYRIFSPNGDGLRDTVYIQQKTEDTGDPWMARIIAADEKVVRTVDFGGKVKDFEWDGNDDQGNVLPDGDYLYVLSNTDAAGNVGEASLALVIDTGKLGALRWRPNAELVVGPVPFTPDEDGENDVLDISIQSGENSGIVSWKLEIIDPKDNVFMTFEEKGAPNTKISWDGLSNSGELLQAASTYKVVLRATDAFGNIGAIEKDLETGIFVIKEADGRLRIRIPSIYFGGYLSDFLIVNEKQLTSNLDTVRTLARLLNKYEDYSITIEGYAAHLLWKNKALRDREQEEVLNPLSRARAENVRRALIILGVERKRMQTLGRGGENPVVPHDDTKGRWKNRRVEFILEK